MVKEFTAKKVDEIHKNPSPVEEKETPTEGDEPKVEENSAILDLVAQLTAVEEAESVDEKAVEKLGHKIEEMSPAAQKVLMDSDIMQSLLEKAAEAGRESGTRKPGEIVRVGAMSYKIPWKAGDLDKFEKVTYTTNQREEYVWNGIPFVFEADESYEIPKPVMQLIIDKRGDAKRAREDIARNGLGRTGVKKLSASGWAGKAAEDAKGVK